LSEAEFASYKNPLERITSKKKLKRGKIRVVVPKKRDKMSCTRTKKVNKNTYNYLVKSERINGRVVQRHLKYIGK